MKFVPGDMIVIPNSMGEVDLALVLNVSKRYHYYEIEALYYGNVIIIIDDGSRVPEIKLFMGVFNEKEVAGKAI